MPIMQSCSTPEKFDKLVVAAVATIAVVFIIFSELCYFAWGSNLTEPIITEMLPPSSTYFSLLKVFFSINLICSYPIMIAPSNIIFENWVFSRCMKHPSTLRHWLKNFSRFIMCISACYFAVSLADKIDKFLGLLGAVLCAPLALTMPALIHLRLLAKTNRAKLFDVILVTISFGIFIFSTAQTISTWNSGVSMH